MEPVTKKQIADLILIEYEFNNYSIDAETLKKIAEAMETMYLKANNQKVNINEFFENLHYGEYGVLFRQASDIISKFRVYIDSKRTVLSY
jgi:transcriptional regulator with XRE-family HTH domain